MDPHRPNSGTSSSAPSGRSPRPRAARAGAPRPSGAEWLEQAALRYAAKWETTERGVCDALERKLPPRCAESGEDPEALRALIPGVVARLVERGYIDDRRYAEQLAARLERQGRSRAYLEAKLRTKGVAEEIIGALSEAAAPDAESQAAWRLAKKRRLGPYCVDGDKRAAQRDKHLGVLARQGFSLELATAIVDADRAPDAEEEEG